MIIIPSTRISSKGSLHNAVFLFLFFTISLGGQVTHCFLLHILFIYEYSRCCELSWGCMTQIPYLLGFCCSSVSSACAYLIVSVLFMGTFFFWGNSDHKIPIPECLAFQVLSFFKGLLFYVFLQPSTYLLNKIFHRILIVNIERQVETKIID